MTDFNRAIQVDDELFSSSLDESEFNNFICHDCDPNCRIEILKDYTVNLIALRNIESSEPITFDYNTTEYDMVEQGVEFHCACGKEMCKKWIRGKRYIIE